MLIYRMNELSIKPKSILFVLASLLCNPAVRAADDPVLQTKNKIITVLPAAQNSAVGTPTPTLSVKADAAPLIVADAKAPIGAIGKDKPVTANDNLSDHDATVKKHGKLKKSEAQPTIYAATDESILNEVVCPVRALQQDYQKRLWQLSQSKKECSNRINQNRWEM